MIGDGGKELRKQALIMSKGYCTPVDVWLGMRLSQFRDWIKAAIELSNELKK